MTRLRVCVKNALYDIILNHIHTYYTGKQFRAYEVADDLGYEPSNVSAYLCKMRDNGILRQTTVDTEFNRNVYETPMVAPMVDNSINKSKIRDMIKSLVPSKSLSDYTDEELVSELKRRMSQ